MNKANIPEVMQTITIEQYGNPEVLIPIEEPVPYPGKGQHLLKVSAAGVNRPDILQRMGLYPAPKDGSPHPGLEVSGEVMVSGRETSRYKPGDKICALVNGGGYSQYCLVDEVTSLPLPKGLNDIEAAGLPETCFTVWHNVFQRGRLKSNEWLLVHGGASGIGTTAIQIANAYGAKVLTTVSSENKKSLCESIGAKKAISYLNEDFVSSVKNITENHGADVILDMIGGDYIDKNIQCAATEGRIVQIAFLNGAISEVNFMRLMLKRLTLTGSTLRSQKLTDKAKIAKEVENIVWPMIEDKKFKPIIDSTFPLSEASNAHKHMESRKHIGKIILTN